MKANIIICFSVNIFAQEYVSSELELNLPARAGQSLITLSDGRVMMFGGADENADLFNDIHVFQENEWAQLEQSGEKPEARKGHEAWADAEDNMYVYGGMGVNQTLLNDLWKYDPVQNGWNEVTVTSSAPRARMWFGSATRPNGNVIMTGGQEEQSVLLDDVWEFSPTSEYRRLGKTEDAGFRQLPNNMMHPSYGHESFIHGNFLWINEVFFGSTLMFKLDLTSYVWESINMTGDVPNYSPLASSVSVATGIFKFGGYSYVPADYLAKTEGFQASAETWFFDYDTQLWTKKIDLPEPLFESCAIYDSENQQIKIYGGMKADSTINDKVIIYHLATTDISENSPVPTSFILYQNFPNPFNPSTRIKFALPEKSDMSLIVYDLLGNEIAILEKGNKPAGEYEIDFDAKDLSSGVYIYEFRTLNFSESKKFVLLK